MEIEKECQKHGVTIWVVENQGKKWERKRCKKCRAEAVARRRRRVKEILVSEHGGKCIRCGYSRYFGALDFHHRDPSTKEFGIADKGTTIAIDRLRKEAAKCDLLCKNCHSEVEADIPL